MFKVYRLGVYPNPRKHFYGPTFYTRKSARQFAKKRAMFDDFGIVIVHPDGREESFESASVS